MRDAIAHCKYPMLGDVCPKNKEIVLDDLDEPG